MSKIALEGNASGTGTLTIAAPNTSTDRTLDIPDASGTIDRLNRAGNVLQVVQGTYGTKVQTTGSTFIDSGLSASITPTSASSKILVMVSQSGVYHQADSGSGVSFRLLRDSTTILNFGEYAGYQLTNNLLNMQSVSYLDSPSSTSSVTYKTQFANSDNNVGTAIVQERGSSSTSTIILMEIAG